MAYAGLFEGLTGDVTNRHWWPVLMSACVCLLGTTHLMQAGASEDDNTPPQQQQQPLQQPVSNVPPLQSQPPAQQQQYPAESIQQPPLQQQQLQQQGPSVPAAASTDVPDSSSSSSALPTQQQQQQWPPDVPWGLDTVVGVLSLWLLAYVAIGQLLVPSVLTALDLERAAMCPRELALLNLCVDCFQAALTLLLLAKCLGRYRPRTRGLFPLGWQRGRWLTWVAAGEKYGCMRLHRGGRCCVLVWCGVGWGRWWGIVRLQMEKSGVVLG